MGTVEEGAIIQEAETEEMILNIAVKCPPKLEELRNFMLKRPERGAQFLRNWLNNDWE